MGQIGAGKNCQHAWIDALVEGLEKEGHDPAAARRLGILAVTVIEGAIVMARGMQSSEPIRQIREPVVELLARPPARRRRRS